jgi:glycosyltransferase involved in cell wall biosynthesis
MKIGFIAAPDAPGGWYRGIGPMLALHQQRGYEIRQLVVPRADIRAELVPGCDVLHVYRWHEPEVIQLTRAAKERGIAIVYDNDDDMTAIPRENENYRDYGALAGERARSQIAKLVQMADIVTVPTPLLIDRYREQFGAARVEVIENYVPDAALSARAPSNGQDVVVGWLAGNEHHIDAERLPLRETFERLLDAHEQLRIRSIGVSLKLRHPRYEHVRRVNFFDLPRAQAQFDVGIAPLADIPFNYGRSNIKVKEYAALGKPWLASPVGPYVGLGEKQGGRLVSDDGWFEAIERLLRGPKERQKLAKRAAKWGREQAISKHVKRWESALSAALARARG